MSDDNVHKPDNYNEDSSDYSTDQVLDNIDYLNDPLIYTDPHHWYGLLRKT